MKKHLLLALLALGTAGAAQAQTFAENTDGDDDAAFSVAVTEWCWIDVDDAPANGSAAPDGNDPDTETIVGGSLVAGTNEYAAGGCNVSAIVSHTPPAPEADDLDEISFLLDLDAPASIESSAAGAQLGASVDQTFAEGEEGDAKEVVDDMQQSISSRDVDYVVTFGRTAASGTHAFNVAYTALPQP
jgi:hypothetical protein